MIPCATFTGFPLRPKRPVCRNATDIMPPVSERGRGFLQEERHKARRETVSPLRGASFPAKNRLRSVVCKGNARSKAPGRDCQIRVFAVY